MSLVNVGSTPGESGAVSISCFNCKDEISHCEATSWGSSSWSCKKCKSNYNRQMERNRKDLKLKKWWQAMEPEAKEEWFREQKILNPEKNKRKVTCSSSIKDIKADEDMKHDVNDGIPKSDFCLELCVMGLSMPHAEKKWEEAIADDNVEKEWHKESQQWLVKRFRGTRSLTGSRTAKQQEWDRKADIEDGQDMEEAENSRKVAATSSAAWLKRAKNSRASGSSMVAMEGDHIEEHDVRVQNAQTVSE